jgi:hypothetical protein
LNFLKGWMRVAGVEREVGVWSLSDHKSSYTRVDPLLADYLGRVSAKGLADFSVREEN